MKGIEQVGAHPRLVKGLVKEQDVGLASGGMIICNSSSHNRDRVTDTEACQIRFNRYFCTRVMYYQAAISKHTGISVGV